MCTCYLAKCRRNLLRQKTFDKNIVMNGRRIFDKSNNAMNSNVEKDIQPLNESQIFVK